MRFDTTIILIGDTERETFARKKSAGRAEVYAAAAVNLKPSVVFEVWTSEYQGELSLRHLGTKHKVIRTYARTDGITELTCEVRIGG